jgi:uncharacterized protein
MKVWAIADLHLPFADPSKDMAVFGPAWENYTTRVSENWHRLVSPDDLVLVAGDISWAMRPDEAKPDLDWIDALPGTKVICRGNHDYWWGSRTKALAVLPPSMHLLHHSAFLWNDIAIAGTRLWDTDEYGFVDYTQIQDNPRENKLTKPAPDSRIFERELGRLETALSQLDPNATHRIAMTHYPPIGADLADSRASKILEKHNVHISVFGHLHSLDPAAPLFGEKNGIRYHLTSCDYIDCTPIQIL